MRGIVSRRARSASSAVHSIATGFEASACSRTSSITLTGIISILFFTLSGISAKSFSFSSGPSTSYAPTKEVVHENDYNIDDIVGYVHSFELFKKAKCHTCHNGPMFSDYKMHVLGLADNNKLKASDSGFKQTYAFRTPTLRNLRHTAPYMHNGTKESLIKVLEFYEDISSGNSKNPNIPDTEIDSLVKDSPLKVQDMSLIISFLNSLNSEDFDKSIPTEVPSKLQVGGNIL